MTKLIQTIVDGLGVGSTYALLALGISLIFGVMHLVNFAHGELITVGAYASYFFFLHGGSWWWMPFVIIGSAVLASVASRRAWAGRADADTASGSTSGCWPGSGWPMVMVSRMLLGAQIKPRQAGPPPGKWPVLRPRWA